MQYGKRISMLIDAISRAYLNDEEFRMMWGILELSKDRNKFNQEYNNKINEILKKKGSVVSD